MNTTELRRKLQAGSVHTVGSRYHDVRAMQAPEWTRYWLWVLVAMVIVMVAIGGSTRLTGSGLSITEWKPLTGAIPPLSDVAWMSEFDKYRQSSQYELLNAGMSLADFKSIYWWEWVHRQFGRLIGIVFLVPFLFLVRGWMAGRVSGSLILSLLGICVLGGLQAVVGWIMVASGLKPGMIAVEPVKLMLHLVVAAFILFSLVNLARGLTPVSRSVVPDRINRLAKVVLGLLFLQIALGALVAGSHAGLTYNTWPLMDGHLIPPTGDLFVVSPWYENFFDNVTMVQFQHRMVAYCLVAAVLVHACLLRKMQPHSRVARQAAILAAFIALQAILGVATLLLSVPLWAGLAHQILAMMTLSVGTYHTLSITGAVETVPVKERDTPIILEMDQTFNA